MKDYKIRLKNSLEKNESIYSLYDYEIYFTKFIILIYILIVIWFIVVDNFYIHTTLMQFKIIIITLITMNILSIIFIPGMIYNKLYDCEGLK